MKRTFILLEIVLFFFLSASYIYATSQGPEIVYYNGRSYNLYSTYPLSSYYKNRTDQPKFQFRDTAHHRGYTGTWEISDGTLYLVDIDGWLETDIGLIKASPRVVFGDRCIDGRVEASWFTGSLNLPDGKLLENNFGYNDVYEREMILQIENGKIKEEKDIDNTKSNDWIDLNTRLFEAIEAGNFSGVRNLLDEGADPNAIHPFLSSATLIQASRDGNLDIVRLLLERGADAKAKNNGGFTALIEAGGSGMAHLDIVKLLVENGADVTAETMGGITALSHESVKGGLDAVGLLIEKGADVNFRDGSGRTALMDASQFGHSKVVRLLLENNADVNISNDDGNTALTLAGNAEILQMLEKAGATYELDVTEGLIIAVREGNVADAGKYLDRGADVNAIIDGILPETLLMRAALDGKTEMVRLLLDWGADVNGKGVYGRTALMQAAMKNHTEVMKLLLDRGADMDAAADSRNSTALEIASINGHVAAVELLLERRGADLNDDWLQSVQEALQTALSNAHTNAHIDVAKAILNSNVFISRKGLDASLGIAVFFCYTDIVRMLLEKGARPDVKRAGSTTLLDKVKLEGDSEMAALLEKAVASAPPRDPSELLIETARDGNLKAVQTHLERGADVNASDDYGRTALMGAVIWGHDLVAGFLIEKGADVNAVDAYGDTALMMVSTRGSIDIACQLLGRGAEVNARNVNGETPLMNAVSSGRTDVIRLLIDNGADVNIATVYRGDEERNKRYDGQTALYRASRKGQVYVVRLLLERGARVDLRTADGRTALMAAIESRNSKIHIARKGGYTREPIENHDEIIALLLSEGADVNAAASDGETALMIATGFEEANSTLIRKLLELGADVNAKTRNGETALFRACQYGHPEIVRLLLDSGADVNTKTTSGGTPLNIAEVQYYENIVQMLIQSNIHAEGALYVPHEFGKPIQIDLNGDKKIDTVTITYMKNIEPEVDGFRIEVNDQVYDGFCQMIRPSYFLADIDSSDRFLEIAIEEDGPSDDPATTFFRYDNALRKLGQVPGNSQHFLTGNSFSIRGDGIIHTKKRGRLLHTWWYDAEYDENDDKICLIEADFRNMNQDVTLRQDLPVYKGINNKEISKTLKKGEKVRISKTDDDSWCEIDTSDGVAGWIEVERFSWINNVNDYADNVFEGLFYAD